MSIFKIKVFLIAGILQLIIVFGLFGQSAGSKDISSLFSTKPTVFRGDESLSKGVLLDLDLPYLERIYSENNFDCTMEIPLSYEENIVLELTRFTPLDKNFILRTSSGDTISYKQGIYYKGSIKGHDGFCTVSIFDDHLIGIISIKGKGDYNLGKIENQRKGDYIILNDRDLNRTNGFECHTADPVFEDYEKDMNSTGQSRVVDCIKVYIEGDYALNLDKGGVQPATDYITALFAEVAALYDVEDIPVEIAEIMVWDEQDPYSTNDAGVALDQFEANNPTFNGDLAQLFALGGNGTGGLAWVDVLCGWSPYAYENISSSYAYYPNYSWSVEVVAHEMGHNIGSRHTHACVWNGNNTQIDDCGNEWANNNGSTPEGNACYDPNNPELPASGTVMSYCHLISSIGIDLANGFGPLPGDLIRSKYNSAGCLTACTGGVPDAPVASFDSDATELCAGEFMQFYDLSSNTPTVWEWTFEGGDPEFSFDQNPYVYYEFPGTYDVTLYVSNAGGDDQLIIYDYITAHEPPVSNFEYEFIENNEVHFTNLSEFSDYYLWDFGDGYTSAEVHPVHSYNFDGTYEVFLYAENNNCAAEDVFSVTLTIVTEPVAGMKIPVSSGCKPLVVNFKDSSSLNVTNWLWVFEGGTPDTSYLTDPVVTYDTSGIFNVSLTVSNSSYSDMLSYTDTIEVLDVPVAGFTPVINGDTVTFNNNSVASDSLTWDFGDGNGSTEENPVHVYQNGGSYTVVLEAINSCGKDTTDMVIQITLEPLAGFTVDADTICVSDTAFFSSLSNTTNIEWIFDGGNPDTSIELNPKVVYDTPGSFTVTQYAYNSLGGDTLEIENYITVLPNPSGSFQSSVDAYMASFTQSLDDANSFEWDFGDNSTDTTEDPTHTYALDGTYTVTLTAFGTCDTITISNTVVIANPPDAAFTMDVSEGCADFSVHYTNASSPNTDSYLWTFEGGNPSTSTEENPTVAYETAGVFSVMLQAMNEQGQDVMFQDDTIHVFSTPLVDFSYTSNLLSFNFVYPGDSSDTVTWNFGDGSNSTELNPAHTYATEGTYNVTLTGANQCGESSITKEIEAIIKPEANFAYDVSEGCVPLTVNYTNQTTGNPSSILWLFDGGTPSASSDENPSVIYYTGGEFSTQLLVFSSNGNDTLLMTDIISVDDGPDPSFYFITQGAMVKFTNQTEGADSYIWNFGDGNASIEESPSHTYTANGDYTVTLYASNECGQNAVEIIISITTVATEDLLLDGIVLYPNPNTGYFSLEFNANNEHNLTIQTFDLLGRIMDKRQISISDGYHLETFRYEYLEKGIYILDIANGEAHRRIKFVIQ